tara:strand:+ start:583 stop:1683 length:1101 start_codon:yes stop_codon:yes gene_type:complete
MSLQCGIIGLPNVGKSTLFNALTASNTPAENYPFCTIEPHIGIVALPDPRLKELGKIYNPKQIIPATIEFTDIAGLVKGASKGEGLGNQFLGQIRQTTAIIHVVRCFEDKNITHVDGEIDPIRDAKTIETELLLADIETLEKRYQKTIKRAKTGDKASKNELDLLNRLLTHCNNGNRARTLPVNQDEKKIFRSIHLLTSKPILYVANVAEAEIMHTKTNKHVQALYEFANREGNSAIDICASIEQEIAVFPDKEKVLFLQEYQLSEPGLHKVIRAGFQLLGLHTFFTCGKRQVRAWTIPNGSTAPKAAGVIHTDFERGFIKAEVFNYDDMIKHGSETTLSNLGLIRQEGKKYIVQDGDCIYFRFNV